MNGRRLNAGSVVIGVVFFVLGVGFLLDSLEVWDVRLGYVWPVLLIGLGLSIILRAGRSRAH